MENKKGLSAIVATLIIILLAIVAFGIVSVVVKQTVTKGAESIELSGKCLETEIHATKIAQVPNEGVQGGFLEGIYDITLSRSASGEIIDGVKVILINADETESVSDEILGDIEPLSKFTPQVIFAEFTLGFVPASVTVVPFFVKDSGETHYCENAQTDELTLE